MASMTARVILPAIRIEDMRALGDSSLAWISPPPSTHS